MQSATGLSTSFSFSFPLLNSASLLISLIKSSNLVDICLGEGQFC